MSSNKKHCEQCLQEDLILREALFDIAGPRSEALCGPHAAKRLQDGSNVKVLLRSTDCKECGGEGKFHNWEEPLPALECPACEGRGDTSYVGSANE